MSTLKETYLAGIDLCGRDNRETKNAVIVNYS